MNNAIYSRVETHLFERNNNLISFIEKQTMMTSNHLNQAEKETKTERGKSTAQNKKNQKNKTKTIQKRQIMIKQTNSVQGVQQDMFIIIFSTLKNNLH